MSSYLREQFQNLLIFRLCFGFLFGIVCVFSFQGTYLALSAIPAEKFIFSARITGKAFAFPVTGDFHSFQQLIRGDPVLIVLRMLAAAYLSILSPA